MRNNHDDLAVFILGAAMIHRIKHGDVGYSYEIHDHEPVGYFYLIYYGDEKFPYVESSEWYETKSEAVNAAETHITSKCEDGEF